MNYAQGKCQSHTTYKDAFGDASYYPCTANAKYSADYIDGVTGKWENKQVCGVHLNSLKHYATRLKKRMQYDIKLTFKHI